jgi:hypothetical protein
VRAIQSAAAAVILAALGLGGCAHRAAPVPTPTPTAAPTVPHVPSPLNGLAVLPKSIKHRVTAVMIDNYPYDARPQSGLRDADIVYEVEAEGGITRYMALFLENMPAKIGPVRSARLYFVDLARPYDPYFAHAGENDDVWEPLKELRAGGFADMEEILIAEEAFWRDDAREMPHNLYTSIARLRDSGPKHGWDDTQFKGPAFAFSPAVPQTAAPGVTLDFWLDYTVRFIYHDGAYVRSIGGVVQHDLDDATPYKVADVVAVWIPATVLDSLGDLSMSVYGDYPALLVRDGAVYEGTWSASGPSSLPRLMDANGADMALAPGQIYIEVLPQGGRVTVGKQSWQH